MLHLETRCKQPRVNLGREREAKSRLLWLRATLSLNILRCLRGHPPTIRRRGSRRLLPGSRAAVLYDRPESPQFPEVLNKPARSRLCGIQTPGALRPRRVGSGLSFEFRERDTRRLTKRGRRACEPTRRK